MRVRQFVADASHELRTPLASIRGYAELTRRSTEAVPPDVAHALGRVESEAERMTGLVDDLLLLARLDSGRPLDHADRRPVPARRRRRQRRARRRAPTTAGTSTCPPSRSSSTGDGPRLHQVVANLLANARTHTPAGHDGDGAARGRCSRAAPSLTVADDGPGIPADLLPDVFERFARGDHSRSRAAGSTGLGLAIVAAVVEAHGGQRGRRERARAHGLHGARSRPQPTYRRPSRPAQGAPPSSGHDDDGPLRPPAPPPPSGRSPTSHPAHGSGHRSRPGLHRRGPAGGGRRRAPRAAAAMAAGSGDRPVVGPTGAARPPAPDRRALPLGPLGVRLGQLVLLGRRAGRLGELEGVLLRLVRRRRTRSPSTRLRRRCG